MPSDKPLSAEELEATVEGATMRLNLAIWEAEPDDAIVNLKLGVLRRCISEIDWLKAELAESREAEDDWHDKADEYHEKLVTIRVERDRLKAEVDEAGTEIARLRVFERDSALPARHEYGRLDSMWQEMVAERDRLKAEVATLTEERDDADAEAATCRELADIRYRQLSNLLARIHRDGGHYHEKHGTKKAVDDADHQILVWLGMEDKLAEREREVESLGTALRDDHSALCIAESKLASRDSLIGELVGALEPFATRIPADGCACVRCTARAVLSRAREVMTG